MPRNLFHRSLGIATLAVALATCGGGSPETEQVPAETQPQAEEPVAQQPAGGATQEAPQRAPSQRATRPAIVQEPASSPFGFYTIQISSWRTLAKAESEARRYREVGLEAYVQKAEIPERGTWYRVRVGSYPSLTAAKEALAALNIADPGLWVDNFKEVPPS